MKTLNIKRSINNAKVAVDLIDDRIIDHLIDITQAKPEWQKVNLETVKVFESLCKQAGSHNVMEKAKVFNALVDILTRGIAEENLAQSLEADKEGNKAMDDKSKAEKLSYKEEQELREAAVSALRDITDPNAISDMKIALDEISQTFAKQPSSNTVKALQKQQKVLSTAALVPKVAELLISGGIPEKVAKNAKTASLHPNFDGKQNIIKTCTLFFEHLAHHGNDKDLRELLTKPQFKQAALETIMAGLGKDNDETTVRQAMKAAEALMLVGVIESKDKFTGERGEISSEKVINSVITQIKRFEDEETQVAGLNLLILLTSKMKFFNALF